MPLRPRAVPISCAPPIPDGRAPRRSCDCGLPLRRRDALSRLLSGSHCAPPQTLELVLQGLCRGGKVGGMKAPAEKRASANVRVKPDPRLPGDLEYAQRFGVIPGNGVGCPARPARHSAATNRLAALRANGQAGFCRRPLREDLGKLAQLDEAGIRVVFEVALSLSTHQDELRIVFFRNSNWLRCSSCVLLG